MPLRYTCDEPGLEDNWLDISDTWTLRERREFIATTTDDEVIAWARKKVDACHIVATTGATIDQGADLTLSGLDDVDLRVQAFIGRALLEAVGSLGNLGNARARQSSNGRVKATIPTIAAPA